MSTQVSLRVFQKSFLSKKFMSGLKLLKCVLREALTWWRCDVLHLKIELVNTSVTPSMCVGVCLSPECLCIIKRLDVPMCVCARTRTRTGEHVHMCVCAQVFLAAVNLGL